MDYGTSNPTLPPDTIPVPRAAIAELREWWKKAKNAQLAGQFHLFPVEVEEGDKLIRAVVGERGKEKLKCLS